MRRAALCIALLFVAACVKAGNSVWLEVRNESGERLRNLSLRHGANVIKHDIFSPGMKWGGWVRVPRSRPLVLSFTDAAGELLTPPLEQALTTDMISGSLVITIGPSGQIDQTYMPWDGTGPNGNTWLENHSNWILGAAVLLAIPLVIALTRRLWQAVVRSLPEMEYGQDSSLDVLDEAATRLGMKRQVCPVLYDPDLTEPIIWWEGRTNGRMVGLLDSGMIWIGTAGSKTLCVFKRTAPGGPFTVQDHSSREGNTLIGDPTAARLLSELSIRVDAVDILSDAIEAEVAWDGAQVNGIVSDIRILSALKSRSDALDPPLVRAIMRGDESVARAMLRCGAELEAVTLGRLNAITAAASAGMADLVAALLAAGARAQPEHGFPLHAAAAAGHLDTVKVLLDAGVPVDLRDEEKNTALIEAAAGGHNVIVALLLSRGAEPGALNADHATALQYAEDEGFTLVVAMIRAASSKRPPDISA